jgi:hypothetical protein
MTGNLFVESMRARVARDKKTAAEVEAGLRYLHNNVDRMSGEMRASALRWTERYDGACAGAEQVAKDMIAVRIGPDVPFAAVGAKSYFAYSPP